jgi:predicted ABC-type ATPase
VAEPRPTIWVLAGVNGAGKSSIGGAMLTASGGTWFNPDAAAKSLREHGVAPNEANARGWSMGFELLQRAVNERKSFLFETTLGGRTITDTLIEASRREHAIRVWYCGLDTVERHLARIARRVAEGGHDIPEALVRTRFEASRVNLIRLLPVLTELRLLDNSVEHSNPRRAKPRTLLHLRDGELLDLAPPGKTPDWAKPVIGAALS